MKDLTKKLRDPEFGEQVIDKNDAEVFYSTIYSIKELKLKSITCVLHFLTCCIKSKRKKAKKLALDRISHNLEIQNLVKTQTYLK